MNSGSSGLVPELVDSHHRQMLDSLIAVLFPEVEQYIAGREQSAQVDADQSTTGVFEGDLIDVIIAGLQAVRKRLVHHFGYFWVDPWNKLFKSFAKTR